MLPAANIQLFVNGHRRRLVERSEAGGDGHVAVRLALTPADLATGSTRLAIEARLIAGADQCAEAERPSARVHIDPASSLELQFDDAAGDARARAVDLLPVEVVFSLAARAFTAEELDATLNASARLAQEGHSIRFVQDSGQRVPAVAQGNVLPADVLRWHDVEALPPAINPTFAALGATRLSHDLGNRGEWRLPLDLRTFPPGRLPERLVLRMIVAPDQSDDHVSLRVLLNDRLLRDVDLRGNGTRRTIRAQLPLDELRVYNEVRIIAERAAPEYTLCTHEPPTTPSQIQEDSYVVLTETPARPHTVSTLVSLLPAQFDLFLPFAEARRAPVILPLLLSAARSLWGPRRAARVHLYAGETPAALAGPAIVVQPSLGTETVVHSGSAQGHPVLWIRPAIHEPAVPDLPEAFGNSDSLSFGATARVPANHRSATAPGAEIGALDFALSHRLLLGLGFLAVLTGGFATYARVRRWNHGQ